MNGKQLAKLLHEIHLGPTQIVISFARMREMVSISSLLPAQYKSSSCGLKKQHFSTICSSFYHSHNKLRLFLQAPSTERFL